MKTLDGVSKRWVISYLYCNRNVFTKEAYVYIFFASALDDIFSGFKIARKAAWLKLTQL